MLINDQELDLKKLRENLISARAVNQSNIDKAIQIRDRILKAREMIPPADVEFLATQGIYLENFLKFDVDRARVDEGYKNEFLEEASKLLVQLRQYLLERKAKL